MSNQRPGRPRVLITGGTGFLAINWACAVRDRWDVVLGTHRHQVAIDGVSSRRLDFETPGAFGRALVDAAPDLVVHTAGLTDVDRCDADPAQARAVNAALAREVASETAARRIRLVHISTDHLFTGDRPLVTEDEPPRPVNEYGRSKRLAEEWVLEAAPGALLVRTNFFGWGHAARRSFTDWIIYTLREGRALSAFDDVFFTPILADRLAASVAALSAGGGSGIYNVCGDERISKYDFALAVARAFDLPAHLIGRASIDGAGLRAPRPRDMSLDSGKMRRFLNRPAVSTGDDLQALAAQERAGRREELLRAVSS